MLESFAGWLLNKFRPALDAHDDALTDDDE